MEDDALVVVPLQYLNIPNVKEHSFVEDPRHALVDNVDAVLKLLLHEKGVQVKQERFEMRSSVSESHNYGNLVSSFTM